MYLDIYILLCTCVFTFQFSDFRCTWYIDASSFDPSKRGSVSQAHDHWLGGQIKIWEAVSASSRVQAFLVADGVEEQLKRRFRVAELVDPIR